MTFRQRKGRRQRLTLSARADCMKNWKKISSGRITVFISHRLDFTRLSNHIFVLKGGGVCEEGTHEELMEKEGHYYEMYQARSKWYA